MDLFSHSRMDPDISSLHTFARAAPSVWNVLPNHVHLEDSSPCVWTQLESHFLREALSDLWVEGSASPPRLPLLDTFYACIIGVIHFNYTCVFICLSPPPESDP